MTWLSVMSQLVSTVLGAVALPTGLAALAAVAVTGLLLVVLVARVGEDLADPATSPTRTRAIALRERSRHTAPLRLRDPDAPGRTRSRAPGCSAAA